MLGEPRLIDDPEVLEVAIEECGEALVAVTEFGIATAGDHPHVTSRDAKRFCCRVAVAEMLVRAQSALPDEIRLCVAECYRPLSLQQEYWERVNVKLRGTYPSWPDTKVAAEAAKYVAPPWITPPHSTGGAVDLVLISHEGVELDMGCALNEQCPRMMTDIRGLSLVATANRQLLVDAMESAGFVNYRHEWWHYSYGDRYWAFHTNSPVAVYGGK